MTVIYGLRHPETGELRYIGKANDAKKRMASHMRDAKRKRTPLYDWINTLSAPPVMDVMHECAPDQDWRYVERLAIAHGRKMGVRLLNLADGGDQPSQSPEQRAANGRAAVKAREATERSRKVWNLKRAIGLALKKGYVSEVWKERLREHGRKNPVTWSSLALIK